MHIYLKQEYMSFHNTFFGYTAAEEQTYSIKNTSFLPWHKIEIKDDQLLIATIKQKYFGLKPNYAIFDIYNKTIYELRRLGDIKTGIYRLAGKTWTVLGDFINLNFAIVDIDNTQIASVAIHETPIGEAVDIFFVEKTEDALILAIVISVYHDRKDTLGKLKK